MNRKKLFLSLGTIGMSGAAMISTVSFARNVK